MIGLILGGAPTVWRELAEAQALINQRHMIVAANLAGIHFTGHLNGWATLHAEHLAEWSARRQGNGDFLAFIPADHHTKPRAEIVTERWPGSSGLYAAQVALFEMGASAVILCGIPMDREAGHFDNAEPWAPTESYREAFRAALPVIGGRVRSMDGWTAELFGRPSATWITSVSDMKPLGAVRLQNLARTPMHTVKNVSKVSQRFRATDANGRMISVRLAPGESGPFEIDPAQAAFQSGALETSLKKAASAPDKA